MPTTVQTVRCGGRLLDLSRPKIMGILNSTPDSFYDGGYWNTEKKALERAEMMLSDGASVLDIGGVSTRPGSSAPDEKTEYQRVVPLIRALFRTFPQTIISVDTFRANIAKEAVYAGASIVNDVSGGQWDKQLLPTVAQLPAAYVLMHSQGTPNVMQQSPQYQDVVQDVSNYFAQSITQLHQLGIWDILLDVGFGFGKSLQHNYRLLKNLHLYTQQFSLPLLVGLSRKSMVCKVLDCKPLEALNGSTALHWEALQQGAQLLRVHDVKEAAEVLKLWSFANLMTND